MAKNKAKSEAVKGDVDTSIIGLDGFEEVGGEVEAFWDPATGPLFGKVREARIVMNKKRGKPTGYYVVELTRPTPCTRDGGDTKSVEETGTLVGVWVSAGLKVLSDMASCEVFISRHPDKKPISGGDDMWTYDLRCKGARGTRVPMVDLRRKEDGDMNDIPF
jgi:hypothetical protein